MKEYKFPSIAAISKQTAKHPKGKFVGFVTLNCSEDLMLLRRNKLNISGMSKELLDIRLRGK